MRVAKSSPPARGCHWWRNQTPPPRTAHYWLLVVRLKSPRNGWRVLVGAPQPDTRGGAVHPVQLRVGVIMSNFWTGLLAIKSETGGTESACGRPNGGSPAAPPAGALVGLVPLVPRSPAGCVVQSSCHPDRATWVSSVDCAKWYLHECVWVSAHTVYFRCHINDSRGCSVCYFAVGFKFLNTGTFY